MEGSRVAIALLSAVAGSLLSLVGVRQMNVRWKHRTRVAWVGRDMLLQQPPIRSWLGVGVFALVLVMLPIGSAIRGPSNPTTPAMVAFLIALGLVVGAIGWVIGRRSVLVSAEAIELTGFCGRRMKWAEIETVQGFSAPHRKVLVFSNGQGNAIAVDSTYYGWEEFLEKVPQIVPKVAAKIEAAIASIEESV